jgi:SAM-dependent methyltransferase/transcriptional regulator with XRE-family HTH domain
MTNTHTTTALQDRLAECANKVGGKRALAKLSGISEAQLARYINGQHEPQYTKLLKIAEVAKTPADWLLTGHKHMAMETDLLKGKIEASEHFGDIYLQMQQALLEVGLSFTHPQMAEMCSLISVCGLVQKEYGRPTPWDSLERMTNTLCYLNGLKTPREMAEYRRDISFIELKPEFISDFELEVFEKRCQRMNINVYSTDYGTEYFQRVGYSVNPRVKRLIQNAFSTIAANRGNLNLKQVLDVGCGNGRHMKYFSEILPETSFFGVEPSMRAFKMAEDAIEAGSIPNAQIHLGDAYQIPFGIEEFDMAFCFGVFSALPYFPHQNVGINKALNEIRRTLKPNGYCLIVSAYGEHRDYLPFHQRINETSLNEIAQYGEWEILTTDLLKYDCGDQSVPSKTIPTDYQNHLIALLKRKD